MIERTLAEVLDERAARAIEEARSLIAERKRLMDELTANYRHRYEAARKALQGVQKTEAELVANARRWFSGT
ncbi:hypothetical protein [Bradyrhizobium sp. UFLA05-112]